MFNSQVVVGARGRFMINGQQIGFASGVTWSEEYAQEPVDVLDRYEPAEYAITGYRVTLSCAMFRAISDTQDNSLRAANLWPKGGITSDALRENILNFPIMSASAHEVKTDKLIASFAGVRPASRNFTLSPRGLLGKNVSFTALFLTDSGD